MTNPRNPAMDNAQVTQRDIDAWEIYGPKIFNCEMTGPEAFARHRLENADDEEETHKIGIDEGRQEMVREIDLATGGDGEFRYCMNGDPDRHCPDAEAMKARVLDRFSPATALSALSLWGGWGSKARRRMVVYSLRGARMLVG